MIGQQVVEEILDAQRAACPPEYFNIKIPEWHEFRKTPKHMELPVLRTRYDQRTGLNPNNPRQQVTLKTVAMLEGGPPKYCMSKTIQHEFNVN